MTDPTFATSLYVTRQAFGIALAVLALWVGVGPEIRAVVRRLRPSRPRTTAADATASNGAGSGAAAESRAA